LLLHLIQGLRPQAEVPVFLLTARRFATAADTATSDSARRLGAGIVETPSLTMPRASACPVLIRGTWGAAARSRSAASLCW
jgi:hypothetical protein